MINDTEPKKSETWARFVPGEEDAAAYWTVLTDPANVSGHTPIGNAYKFFREKVTSLRDLGELQTEGEHRTDLADQNTLAGPRGAAQDVPPVGIGDGVMESVADELDGRCDPVAGNHAPAPGE